MTLRPPEPIADAADYYEMNLDPEMHEWTGNCILESVAEAQSELQRFAGMDDISTWMILDNPTGRVVGRFFLCLENRDGVRVVGEGNRIAKAFWRKGHNREARALLFQYAFGELQADRIETAAWEGNVNSLKSIESYGFRPDRDERKWNEKHSKTLTMRHYALTKEQWKNQGTSGLLGGVVTSRP